MGPMLPGLHPLSDTGEKGPEYDWSRRLRRCRLRRNGHPGTRGRIAMDHPDQASAATIDAPAGTDGQLPEQSRHVLKGRADVERVRRRKLGMRLARAILVLAAIDIWMISRTSRGLTALPRFPHLDPLMVVPM